MTEHADGKPSSEERSRQHTVIGISSRAFPSFNSDRRVFLEVWSKEQFLLLHASSALLESLSRNLGRGWAVACNISRLV